MVCVRFGMNNIPSMYNRPIKQILDMKQCVGAVGGKPRKSLYFVGYEDDNLLFLDPHYVQEATLENQIPLDSYSCQTPLKIDIKNLDPCLNFGFLITSEQEFDSFIKTIEEFKSEDSQFPIFINSKCLKEDASEGYSICSFNAK